MEEKKKRYKERVARTEFIDEEDDNKDAKGGEVKETRKLRRKFKENCQSYLKEQAHKDKLWAGASSSGVREELPLNVREKGKMLNGHPMRDGGRNQHCRGPLIHFCIGLGVQGSQ